MQINNLTIIPEGNGESARIGRKLTIKQVLWKYDLTLPTTAAPASTSDIVKIMLVLDMQTNGAQFTAANLLDTDAWDSFRNLANSKRFKVLMSKTYAMKSPSGSGRGVTDTVAFGEDVRAIQGSKKCNIQIEYDNSATDGSIGTVRSNNLYWVTQSTIGLTTALGNVRLRYTDQ